MEVKIKEFCYTGPSGGTRLSNGTFDTPYPHPEATVKVKRGFYDYECGHRFIGEPADPLLTAFREEIGASADPMGDFLKSGYAKKIAERGSDGAGW